jgi:hypothetical protein
MDEAAPWHIVIADSDLEQWLRAPQIDHTDLRQGDQMGILNLAPADVLEWDGEIFELEQPGG